MGQLEEFLHDRIQQFETLRSLHASDASWRASEQNKTRLSFRDFALNFERFMDLIGPALKSGGYNLGPARRATIFTDKPRTIYRFSWPDTFVMAHLARALAATVEPQMSNALFSYRSGRGSVQALERLARFLRQNKAPFFVCRRDIRHFGESLRHEFVRADFQKFGSTNPDLVSLIDRICRFEYEDGGACIQNQRGLPTGAYLQLVFENLYLSALDHELDCLSASTYVRFGDDLIFLTTDFKQAELARATIERFVAERGLELNPEKSAFFCLQPPALRGFRDAAGVEVRSTFRHLGLVVDWRGEISLPSDKLKKLQKLIKARIARSAALLPKDSSIEERAVILIETAKNLLYDTFAISDNPIATYLGYCRSREQLRALDRWVAMLILKFAVQGGFKAANFRKISFKRLRQLGLPSVQHMRNKHEFPIRY
ncbi:MAG: hypothetical protein K1X83_10720 [Oligoflexia bacterium]|nr:hypothetical protein [Oligoflexia bacterium]